MSKSVSREKYQSIKDKAQKWRDEALDCKERLDRIIKDNSDLLVKNEDLETQLEDLARGKEVKIMGEVEINEFKNIKKELKYIQDKHQKELDKIEETYKKKIEKMEDKHERTLTKSVDDAERKLDRKEDSINRLQSKYDDTKEKLKEWKSEHLQMKEWKKKEGKKTTKGSPNSN